MAATWQSIDADVTRLASAFDASRLSVADAAETVSVTGAIIAKLYAVQALAAARAAEAGATMPPGPRARGRGPARSAAEALAARNGTSINDADKLIKTGQRLSEQPTLRDAAQSGDLSPTQIDLISDAAKDAPDHVSRLIDKANQTSVSGLREECASAKAAADPDPEARQRRAHQARKLRLWAQEQIGRFFGEGTALQNAWLAAALASVREDLRAEARARDERPSDEQLNYDALILLVSRGLGIDLPQTDNPSERETPKPQQRAARDLTRMADDAADADDADDNEDDCPGRRGRRPGGPRDPRSGPGTPLPEPRRPLDARQPSGPARPTAPRDPWEARDAGQPQESSLWVVRDQGVAGDSSSANRWSSATGEMADFDPDAPLWTTADYYRAGDSPQAAPWTSTPREAATDAENDDSVAGDDSLWPDTAPQPNTGASGIRGPDQIDSPNALRKKSQTRRWSHATTIIRVDATAAERGRPVADEICEIAGTGPIPISGVETVLAEGSRLALVSTNADGTVVERVAHVRRDRAAQIDIRDPPALYEELVRTGRDVADEVHQGRRPNAFQLTALRWISPTCTVEGCNNLTCDVDHETGYAVTKDTKLGDLDPLCRYHHRIKTLHGWALVPGRGKRAFVAPDDPAHPRNQSR